MTRPFLTAEWRKLCILSYAVEEPLLAPFLPRGLELDRSGPGGNAYVSLVAFDFLRTRVLGVPWPGHTNFPEVNLRFYAAQPGNGPSRRGVCFVRELVGKPLIAWVARGVYNEPYSTARLISRTQADADGRLEVSHRIDAGGATHSLSVRGRGPPATPGAGSAEHWFKEHEWGFGRARSGRTLVYRVRHPWWAVYRVEATDVRVDWSRLYGPRWAGLQGRAPDSVLLAEGSPVEVYPATAP